MVLGVVGGIYLLYSIGWVVGGLRLKPLANLIVADAMYVPWFVLAVAYGGAEAPPPWWIPAVGLALLAGLFVLAWIRPRAGGIALVLFGLAAAAFFANAWAFGLLAVPAILLGLAWIVLGRRDVAA